VIRAASLESDIDQKLVQAGYQISHPHVSDEMLCHRALASVLRGPLTRSASALEIIRKEPNWLPVIIDAKLERIAWLKFADNLNQEAFFYQAVNRRLKNEQVLDAFSTSNALLKSAEIFPDHPAPMGFIFHMARCGSTLLGRAMAKLRDTEVVYEGPYCLSDVLFDRASPRRSSPSVSDKRMIRNLVNLCSRSPTRPTRYIIKLVSWNILFSDLFFQAFPSTPGVFLYREPMGPMLSCLTSRPRSWPIQGSVEADYVADGDSHCLGYGEYHLEGFAHFFRHALCQDKLNYLNYRHLNPESIGTIIKRGFGYAPCVEELDGVNTIFSVHAKDDQGMKNYQGDQRIPPPPWLSGWLDSKLNGSYQALEHSQRNLFHPQAPSG